MAFHRCLTSGPPNLGASMCTTYESRSPAGLATLTHGRRRSGRVLALRRREWMPNISMRCPPWPSRNRQPEEPAPESLCRLRLKRQSVCRKAKWERATSCSGGPVVPQLCGSATPEATLCLAAAIAVNWHRDSLLRASRCAGRAAQLMCSRGQGWPRASALRRRCEPHSRTGACSPRDERWSHGKGSIRQRLRRHPVP
eukprot:scaffold34543_cov63-Phaeocystis_antarctica.AAC.5